jgi:ABC-type antimicrobial peptide transport system permease subunit
MVSRLMSTLLFGVSPLDPLSFAAVPLTLIAAAAQASFLPASRAAAVNPVDALKADYIARLFARTWTMRVQWRALATD